MSEQRKRLTDAEIAESRRLVKEAPERPILAEVALEMDHDQAREDRKRLAAWMRERIGGSCCDRSEATTGIKRCSWCGPAEAMVAEVDPQ